MKKKLFFLLAGVLLLLVLNVFLGSVHIGFPDVLLALKGEGDAVTSFIVIQHRFPQAVTALLAGAALATSGLLLQTSFHNPLAGPSVFGISGGAALGVAIVVLGGFARSAAPGDGLLAMYFAAFLCAAAVTALLLFVSSVVKSNVALLIVGLLMGYLISAVITLLYALASPEDLHSYVVWGMGDFSSVSIAQLPQFSLALALLLMVCLLMIKPLNVLQLGDSYADNLGVNVVTLRNAVLFLVGMLTAVTTTYCGPIAFIGLAVPHIARLIVNSSDFRVLLPATMLVGAIVAMGCNLLCVMPSNTLLPLNAVTPLVGIPVIVYVVLRGQSRYS